MTSKDDNGSPILYGVSHLDGVTPVRIKFNGNRAMLLDSTTSIAFNSAIIQTQSNLTGYPLAMATSSSDNNTVMPWVVNATTGAVLVDQ